MMKGYIYTMYAGADPGHGWSMNDPIFGPVPTLGACVPNIRRAVVRGDYIFVVSGRVPGERQFVVGGFKVAEKINALSALKRFPQNGLQITPSGQVVGNVIVSPDGTQHPLDEHSNFASRVENYLVGTDPSYFETRTQYNVARSETLDVLSGLFGKRGDRVFDIIGRHRKMDKDQVNDLLSWIRTVKS
jgi:hypothetical protein